MIISMAADDARRQVTLVDISRAYFNAKISRKVFVELPPEAGYGKDFVGELDKCMYGTRDAAQGWERATTRPLRKWASAKALHTFACSGTLRAT